MNHERAFRLLSRACSERGIHHALFQGWSRLLHVGAGAGASVGAQGGQELGGEASPTFCLAKRLQVFPAQPPSSTARRGPRRDDATLFNTAFATRLQEKAKSWRNGHKMGPSGATRQQGLTGGVGGRGLVHNTRVQPLVCAVGPGNTLATPIPLRLTADAIMQDLHQTGCSRPGWSWGAADVLPLASL